MTVRPTIGTAAFVPCPGAQPALWGVAARRWDGHITTVEVLELDDVEALGRPITWLDEGDGSGVRWARLRGPFGMVAGVARAVPLS